MKSVDYETRAGSYAEHRRPHPSVLRSLAGSIDSSSRVLEVGCGTGNYIDWLGSSLGCKCSAVDPSPAMLAQLRRRGTPIRAQLGRAEALDFPDAWFDVVFSVDVIHHVVDRDQAYREAHRVLVPGGLVCTVTDSEWIIRNRPQSAFFPETIPIELARYPSIDSIKSSMAEAGFIFLREDLAEDAYELTDSGPYRAKVFSSLLYLDELAYREGLARLEATLSRGPIPCVSRYVLLWGRKPLSADRVVDGVAGEHR
jgi:SAM-dependent methyltransferase